MAARPVRVPKYRLHKASGQGVVTLNGRDFYLGPHDAEQSRAEYGRLVAEWLVSAPRVVSRSSGDGPSDLSLNELILAYIGHADVYYRKNGKPTTEPANIKLALRPLRRLHGHTGVKDFGPLALKAVRASMIAADLCRAEVNKRTRHIVRMVRWGVENELVPPSVHHGLKAVPGLPRGRSEARESEPVKPAPDASVDAVEPHAAKQVWAMVQLQRLSGMRSGEVTTMRGSVIDRSGAVWANRPERHKTEHHGKDRVIYLGPRAQAVLGSWLRDDPAEYLFSPKEALERHYADRRRDRKSPMTPSQRARRRVQKRRRQPGEHYTSESYCRAIKAACKRAGVAPWHPHQLRHNAATYLRKEFGLDVARVILGHSSLVVTEIYAEVDHEKAVSVMARVG